jgi:UDP-glucose 4-epimerase
MKFLVTGCAGFIGSHLCQRLLKNGYDVIGIDCLTDYYEPQVKLNNLDSLKSNEKFRFVLLDILDINHSRQLVEDADYIVHLAAQPGVRASWGANFDTYLKNNVLATQLLLELARNSKRLRKFVYASSSSVYGQTQAEKVSEEHGTHPHSPYGVTKLAGEHLCSLYEANFGLPTISLRFFTVYGPRQRPDMAFNRLITAALTGGTFSLYGDGTQERDFTFVQDIVDGLMLAALTENATGHFNIGGGHVVSLNEVINLVQQLSGKQINIQKSEPQKGDVRRTSADISKIRSVLGYQPKVQIRDGLRAEVEYFASVLANANPQQHRME